MVACHESKFCDHYMLLKPEDASLFGLVWYLLFSTSNTSGHGFIQCKEEPKLEGFWRRWYIFISLFAQKLLLYLGNPMDKIGKMLELGLNLLSNVLKGNFVWPNRSSAMFTSVVGNLDQRVELDKSIRPSDPKYNASLAMMASKLAYENEAFVQKTVRDHWSMEYLGFDNVFWNDYLEQPSTKAMMFQDTRAQPNLIVVAFKGTGPFDPIAWWTDVDLSWIEFKGVGNVHSGFMKALGLQKDTGWPQEIEQGSNQRQFAYYAIRQRLRDILQENKSAKFILTGHSLGGALAVLFMTVLAMHEEAWLLDRLEGVYTFGQPRVGNKHLGDYMEKIDKYDVKYLRYVYCHDMVPRIPFDDEANIFFEHWGPCVYYNSFYEGEVRSVEPNKNYLLKWSIPKCLNAIWELVRSLIIPYKKGREYKESWLMTIIRLVGLVIPGVAAHCPQDYVNAILLGSLPPDLQNPIHRRDIEID
ncbi:triacylglycerol lipase OBL1-like [Corylus avellana]|uniref:triacylglycerol lipase OBL1-like n=1 Tax=Corylus avellana TaxID=13451 RepID=UPI001E20AAD2|nr:triacylglycerol lipase OBL1-like [Corylus avellana]